jgi:hypothetical protein
MNLIDHRALHAAIRNSSSRMRVAGVVRVFNTVCTAYSYGVSQGNTWGSWSIDLLKDERSTDIVASGESGVFYCY